MPANARIFLKEFCEKYGYTQATVNSFLKDLEDYMFYKIGLQETFSLPRMFTLEYVYISKRKSAPVGYHIKPKKWKKSEFIELPARMGVRLKIHKQYYRFQRERSKVIEKIADEIEEGEF